MQNDIEDKIKQLKNQIEILRVKYPKEKNEKKQTAAIIGNLVKDLREEKGWSIHKLSKILDSNMGNIVKLEKGEKLPYIDLIEKMTRAFEQGERWTW